MDQPSFAAFLDELSSAPGEGRLARGRQRLVDWAQRATTWGPMGPIAEVGWRTWRRDQETAGSVLAAAVAYRLFIWLLPLSLLVVVGVGVQTDVTGESAGDVVEQTGIAGYFARSVAAAAEATTPLTRTLIGGTALVVFLYESYVLLRTLRAVNAFAWGVPVRPMARPGPDTMLFLLLVLGLVALSAAIPPVRDATRPFGLLVIVPATLALVPAWYVAVNLLVLPHGAPSVRHLLPGAALMGAGYSAVQLFNTLLLFPWLARKEETYGVLGVAAGLMLSFFIIGRLFEAGAALNWVICRTRDPARDAAGSAVHGR